MSETSTSQPSSPEVGSESRGSSVSTGLREEYEDLLRYAVVTPTFTGKLPPINPTHQQHQPPRPKSPAVGAGRVPTTEISKVELDESLPIPPPHPHPMTTATTTPHHQQQSMIIPQGRQTDSVITSSSESHDLSHDSEEVVQTPSLDPEMARLENQLDAWCLDLKRNVLAEFDQSRIRMMERHRAELHKEREQHVYELRQLSEELERYKELAVTYEQSISRKDHVIANLTRALQKQKERVELQKSFSSWKIRHSDDKRESFTTMLARNHNHRKLKGRVWAAWFGVVQGRWKLRMERACQVKAEEVCVQLTNEYEERLASAYHSLDESRQEVVQLKAERDLYEENMKKAFMRGVCALNLEAMSMFRHQDPPNAQQHASGYHSDGDYHNMGCHTPQDEVPAGVENEPQTVPLQSQQQNGVLPSSLSQTGRPVHAPPRVILTASAGPQRGAPQTTQPSASQKQPPTIRSGPKSGRKAARNRTVPSVVVERHVLTDKT